MCNLLKLVENPSSVNLSPHVSVRLINDSEILTFRLKLVTFKRFKDTTDALEATASMLEGKLGKDLKKMLKKHASAELQEKLAVADAKLGSLIKVNQLFLFLVFFISQKF